MISAACCSVYRRGSPEVITRRSASAQAEVQRGLDPHDVSRLNLVPTPLALARDAALGGEPPDLVIARRTIAMDTPEFPASLNEAQRRHSFHPLGIDGAGYLVRLIHSGNEWYICVAGITPWITNEKSVDGRSSMFPNPLNIMGFQSGLHPPLVRSSAVTSRTCSDSCSTRTRNRCPSQARCVNCSPSPISDFSPPS